MQRFATEMTRELLRQGGGATGDRTRLLVPKGGAAKWPGAIEAGRLQGQGWEQFELPGFARDGVLINLGNTAPLRLRRQAVVIHDAGVFSTPEAYSAKFRMWYKTMQRILVLRGVEVITVSEFSRQEIIRNLGVRPEQISVMPEGSDHMREITGDRGILQKQRLEPGRFVLAVGNLSAHKNLAALGVLAKLLPEHGMVLAAAGNLVNKAFSSSGGQLLPPEARFLGRVTDAELKALYETAACFVFPSRYEGFGLPAVEAMASGCPMVASAIPALQETCKDAVIYCDPASPEDIARQVLKVCNDASLQDRLRAAGLALTRPMTWEVAAQRMREIIFTKGLATR